MDMNTPPIQNNEGELRSTMVSEFVGYSDLRSCNDVLRVVCMHSYIVITHLDSRQSVLYTNNLLQFGVTKDVSVEFLSGECNCKGACHNTSKEVN